MNEQQPTFESAKLEPSRPAWRLRVSNADAFVWGLFLGAASAVGVFLGVFTLLHVS